MQLARNQSIMADSLTKHDIDSLLEVSKNESSILEPFLGKDKKEPSKSNKRTQLWPVRSAPPPSTETLNGNLQKPTGQSSSSSPSSSGREPPSPFAKDNGPSALLKALMGLGIYLIIGIVGFSLLHNDLGGTLSNTTLVDALYFAIVTMTTVGYGDIIPKGTAAKLFTCAFVFTGFGLIGALVSGLANYLVEKQEKILVKKVYNKYRKQSGVEDDEDSVISAEWKAMVAGVLVLVLFVLGLLALQYWEGMSFIDAFYCVCVTVTTLGYGDQSFQTQAGRIFAIFWILSSTVCVAQFFLYLAEVRTEERQYQIAHWALCRRTTTSDLEAADLDGDGVVRFLSFSFLSTPLYSYVF
jgi:potassium channel subfamily K